VVPAADRPRGDRRLGCWTRGGGGTPTRPRRTAGVRRVVHLGSIESGLPGMASGGECLPRTHRRRRTLAKLAEPPGTSHDSPDVFGSVARSDARRRRLVPRSAVRLCGDVARQVALFRLAPGKRGVESSSPWHCGNQKRPEKAPAPPSTFEGRGTIAHGAIDAHERQDDLRPSLSPPDSLKGSGEGYERPQGLRVGPARRNVRSS